MRTLLHQPPPRRPERHGRAADAAGQRPACNFVMGVPGADDIMLNYQTTSFHDALYVRRLLGLQPGAGVRGLAAARCRSPPALAAISRWRRVVAARVPVAPCARWPEATMTERLPTVTANPWAALRAFTDARIALGRAGTSLPTARAPGVPARPCARPRCGASWRWIRRSWPRQSPKAGRTRPRGCLLLHSAARDRSHYLQRPDLGRRLDADSVDAAGTRWSGPMTRARDQVSTNRPTTWPWWWPMACRRWPSTQNAPPFLERLRHHLARAPTGA